MLRKLRIVVLFGSIVLLAGVALAGARTPARRHARAAAPAASMCGSLSTAPTYKHVIVIFEENNSYNSIYKSASAPYINSVISACGLATAYHNVTHPSLPNYIAATSGTPLSNLKPFLPDCTPSATCEATGDNMFKEANGRGWKGYAESMPSNCDKSNAGFYAPRHNPAVYYTDLTNCATQDVALGTTSSSPLLNDFASEATAPAFSTVTPNLCDDMHGVTGCPSGNLITAGDSWLQQWLPLITATKVYKDNDTAIFIVWDEGEPATKGEACQTNRSDQSCHVVAIVVAPSVTAGTQVSTQLNHYSLLKTSEDLLGFGELGQARSATSMAAGFNL